MEIESSKCLKNGDDSSLRKFKKKVVEKFGFSDNFKIYNSHGILINESEICFLNHDDKMQSIVYISAASK